ncbi:MAG: hypothetical protein H6732_20085 [Alphaproteobacteria bacterium]|nr:hypothetical protein [Alphaproteobacteria bacterium]
MSLSAALLGLLLVARAERPEPLYVTGLSALGEDGAPAYRTTWKERDLEQALQIELGSRHVETFEVRREDAWVQAWPRAKGSLPFSKLTRAELLAVSWVVSRRVEEAELDLLVPEADGVDRAVTVIWDDHRVRAWAGAVVPAPDRSPAPAAMMEVAGATLDAEDAAWSVADVQALTDALGLLSEEERARLGTVRFTRDDEAGRAFRAAQQRSGESRLSSIYEQRRGASRILLYDDGALQSAVFVGSPETPRSPLVRTVLHSLARMLADPPPPAPPEGGASPAPSRLGSDEVPDDVGEEAAPVEDPPSAMARAMLDVMGALERAPTPAGRRRGESAFADAFALAHADPDALERTAPEVLAWFRQGGHLQPAAAPEDVVAPPDVAATLTTKVASGKVEAGAVDAAIQALAVRVARCHADTAKRPELPATVDLRVTVADDGSVFAVDHRDDGRLGKKVDRCVRALLERVHLPPTSDGERAKVHVDVDLAAP